MLLMHLYRYLKLYQECQKKFTHLEGCTIKGMWPKFKTRMSDCVHTMPADFENDEKSDGSKI